MHGEDIDLVENDKYLGDVIATTIQSNGSNQLNINKRKGAAMGVKTQIMLILKTVSLGHHYFEIAVLLRESLLISSSLFNAEVWYALTKSQVSELDQVDRSLLRQVIGDCPVSVLGEGLFLEMGICPIAWILKARRVVFLHYLVTLNKQQMLSRFFWARWKNPVRGDWTERVKSDLKDLGLDMELEQIREMKKEKFKSLVRKACRKSAFNYLISKKDSHSKMRDLSYTDLSIQSYLTSDKIHPSKAKTLFLSRTRMLKVNNNFKQSHADLNCPLCSGEENNGIKFLDDQHHLLLPSQVKNVAATGTSLAATSTQCLPPRT